MQILGNVYFSYDSLVNIGIIDHKNISEEALSYKSQIARSSVTHNEKIIASPNKYLADKSLLFFVKT
jgi:hypothetical protein